MPKIILREGDVTEFSGDALVCPSSTDLTYRKTAITKAVFDKAGEELAKEASAIGYSSLGNAVITKGYDLEVNHVIFAPISDRFDETNQLNIEVLHQTVRSILTLADIYEAKTLAIPILSVNSKRTSLIKKFVDKFINEIPPISSVTSDDVVNIIMVISKEFDKSSLKEISIYKFI
jgi:O-acetyl-ADP-ribose deacetylase (regulator of RNase III)